jgi:hypothetical protein
VWKPLGLFTAIVGQIVREIETNPGHCCETRGFTQGCADLRSLFFGLASR